MKNTIEGSDGIAAERTASELCLACGLCCQGALHSRAALKPDETEVALRNGMTLTVLDDGSPGFDQPCPCHQSGACSIYGSTRPRVCSDYKCRLLKQYLRGEITLVMGLEIVARTKRLIEAVRAGLEGFMEPPTRSLNNRMISFLKSRGPASSHETRSDLPGRLLSICSLQVLFKKHFYEPVSEVAKPGPEPRGHGG